jgi:hypothetical protein
MPAALLLALKWGGLIGVANLAWLNLSYYLGLHTNGIAVFQVVRVGWFLITFTGFLLALRAARRESERWGYLRGLGIGAVAAFVSGLISIVAQVGYFKVVNPGWTDYQVEQMRLHHDAQGLPEVGAAPLAETSRIAFTLGTYTWQSFLTALLSGVLLSAVMMLFLRKKAAVSATGP